MFDSTNTHLFPYTNQTPIDQKAFKNNENPSRSQDQRHQYPSFSSQFLNNPFLNENELFLGHMISQQQIFLAQSSNNYDVTSNFTETSNEAISNNIASKKVVSDQKQKISRKRNRRKDRHSKIYTAQGQRGRRMRLSLQIARKFFDLQDMLGFDKASKTIEWLFAESNSAINELKENFSQLKCSYGVNGCKNVEPLSESEVVSEISRERKSRSIERESRDKARARARERTRAKLFIRDLLQKSRPNYGQSSTHGNHFIGDQVMGGAPENHDFPLNRGMINSSVMQTFYCTVTNVNSSPGEKMLGLDELKLIPWISNTGSARAPQNNKDRS